MKYLFDCLYGPPYNSRMDLSHKHYAVSRAIRGIGTVKQIIFAAERTF